MKTSRPPTRSALHTRLLLLGLLAPALPAAALELPPVPKLVNALLVPLFEPDEGAPLAWRSADQLLPCAENARLRLDGAAVPWGRRLPIGRALRLEWQMEQCWPLGWSWLGWSGSVEMVVLHQGTQLTVRVVPHHLVGFDSERSLPLRQAFDVTLPLQPSGGRP